MIFAVTLAVVIGFISAVALCVQALSAQTVAAFSSEMRVVIDAGHGGIDAGVSGRQTGVKESDVNLAIAMLLKGELEDMGFAVTLTRKTEAGLYGTTAKGFKKRDMLRRKEIIEDAKPSMILSIHQNYYSAQYVRGGQVFYAPQREESKPLAEVLQTGLNCLYAEEGVKARKVTKGEYFLLDCYPCPSVIVECGFLSSEDESLLINGVWQKKLAETLAAGVGAYLSEEAVGTASFTRAMRPSYARATNK